MFPLSLKEYAAERDALLERMIQHLQGDPRFVAAWLAGSFGRGDQDGVSDLDLFVVVDDAYAEDLCVRPVMTGSGSIPARLAIFQCCGEPVNIHENHFNAPESGSFSAVFYRQPPVIVDWVLVPRAVARRAPATRLLFDQVGIPPLPDQTAGAVLSAEERALKLSERTAFFWMMAAIVAKYIVRGSAAPANELLVFVEGVVGEIEQLLNHEPHSFDGSVYPTQSSQAAHLHGLCEQIEAMGLPSEPRPYVEAILGLAQLPPQ